MKFDADEKKLFVAAAFAAIIAIVCGVMEWRHRSQTITSTNISTITIVDKHMLTITTDDGEIYEITVR